MAGTARLLHFDGEPSRQEEAIRRYLSALDIPIEPWTREGGIPEKGLFFADVSLQSERNVRSVIDSAAGGNLVLVIEERQRGIFETIGASSVFPVYVPLTASKFTAAIKRVLGMEGAKVQGAEPDGGPGFKGTALVAEDAPVNQRLIQIMLERLGLTAHIARDGAEAVEMFRSGRYDIIFMDVSMPVLDGIGAAAGIREIETKEGRAHTPVVALTARALKGEREYLLESGMDDYVSKPVDMAALRRVAERFLEAASDSQKEKEADQDMADLDETALSLGIERTELDQLLREFLDSSGEYLELIEGAAANYRLTRLSGLSGELESAAEEGREAAFRELAADIRRELERLISLINGK
jgi:CheY-like chemotaxis protein